MVRERDDRPANAQDHRRVDLAVRVRARVRLVQVRRRHGDHRRLLLLCVDELDEAGDEELRPAEVAGDELEDVALAQLEPLRRGPGVARRRVLDDQKRAADAAGVGVDAELLFLDVSNDRDLRINVHLPPERPQRRLERGRVAVDADPRAVDEDLRGAYICVVPAFSRLIVTRRENRRLQSFGARSPRGSPCSTLLKTPGWGLAVSPR
mmetsp:Transcript_5010/g.17733  ORF Transcript_5010/g.17733 Transcript_5010/m.17733 type:complete len:208 (+) Transcript_5010:1426-2049(+)